MISLGREIMTRKTRPVQWRDAQGAVIPFSVDQAALRSSKNGGSNLVYVAYARPGTLNASAGWRIVKNTYDSGNDIVMTQFAQDESAVATNDFVHVWDDSAAFTITAITKAADAEVTTSAAHGYSTNDVIEITGSDMTEVNGNGYGSLVFTITKVDATKFTLGVNSSGYVGVGTSGSAYKRDYLNYTYS